MIRKADFNVGSHINSMFRVMCRSDPSVDKRAHNAERKHITYFGMIYDMKTLYLLFLNGILAFSL